MIKFRKHTKCQKITNFKHSFLLYKLLYNCFPRQYFDLFYISDSFSESISSIENQNLANLENFAKMSKHVKIFQNFMSLNFLTLDVRLISRVHF